MLLHVILEESDGWIVAECPALPGCISQGKDEQEALENIKDAISTYLASIEDLTLLKKLRSPL